MKTRLHQSIKYYIEEDGKTEFTKEELKEIRALLVAEAIKNGLKGVKVTAKVEYVEDEN